MHISLEFIPSFWYDFIYLSIPFTSAQRFTYAKIKKKQKTPRIDEKPKVAF